MTKETLTTLPKVAYGLAGGVAKYYVQPELTAKRMWTAIGVGVLAYELTCPEGELLSEQYDRWLDSEKTRRIAQVGTWVTAAHLTNLIPPKCDPFTIGLNLIKGNRNDC